MEFRPPLAARVLLCGPCAFTGSFAVYAALPSGAAYPEAALMLAGFTVVLGAFAWRAWHLRITTDDDGVLVLNYLSTVFVPWADVAGFPATRYRAWLRRHDGREHQITMLQTTDSFKTATSPRVRARRDAFVAALQEEHRRRVPG